MSLTFPLVADEENPHYAVRVALDALTYVFEFRWSEREACWYADMLDEQEEPIHLGQKIVLGIPLFGRCRDARRPPGMICAMDTSGQDIGPVLGDLGARVILLYYTADELGA